MLQIRGECRAAHFLAIPLLTTPAKALRVDDACSGATAAFVFLHGESPIFRGDRRQVSTEYKFCAPSAGIPVAGEMAAGTGHHHLIVNGSSIKEGEVVPFNDTHLHFGKGQTETELTLVPGNYTLTLHFANGAHQSYGEPMSKRIEVVVK